MKWECLSWQDVRSLRSRGVEFGSHTVTHAKLSELATPDIEWQLREAKVAIERETGDKVETFSYPYAFPEEKKEFVSNLRRMLADSGYTIGVTTKIGRASRGDCPFFLKRLPMSEHDDLLAFKAKLEGGYDWVHILQKASKHVASLLRGH
jgi:peptidoglycan/xylan/chitin deacetylase (PgdA/CDA1 family)